MKTWKHNYHSHTLFSDGKDSLEATLLAAEELQLSSFGISDHSPALPKSRWNMGLSTYETYLDALFEAKKQLRSFKLFAGLELDYLGGEPQFDPTCYSKRPDYIVGSVHHIHHNGTIVSFDGSKDKFQEIGLTQFGGNYKELVLCYFSMISSMIERMDFDILGHVDLVKKFNQENAFYREEANWYIQALTDILDLAKKKNKIVEINCGSISRGYRSEPYPGYKMIAYCLEKKIPMTLNSDSHKATGIVGGYAETLPVLETLGVRSLMVLTETGWKEESL